MQRIQTHIGLSVFVVLTLHTVFVYGLRMYVYILVLSHASTEVVFSGKLCLTGNLNTYPYVLICDSCTLRDSSTELIADDSI